MLELVYHALQDAKISKKSKIEVEMEFSIQDSVTTSKKNTFS